MSHEVLTQITIDMVTSAATKVGNHLFEKLKKMSADNKAKYAIDFGKAFEDYLVRAKERCEKVKTLLYRHQAKNLYDFYECVGVECNETDIDTKNVNNLLCLGHKLIISGTGGIGKTILLKHLFLNCIEQGDQIPVFVELRHLNDHNKDEIDLKKYLYENMSTFGFSLAENHFEYSLKEGCYLVLFDGFDEVKSDKAHIITQQIKQLADKYPDNYYIVSSRPMAEFIGWSDFDELRAQPLSKEQALSLIDKLDYDPVIKKKFYQELDKRLYDKYSSFASNPLLLTIMLITFEDGIDIPDNLNDFYEQAFDALFRTHDATKGAYKRDILTELGCQEFKSLFSYFCFKSYFNAQYFFTKNDALIYIDIAREKIKVSKIFSSEDYLHDLTHSVCMLVKEGLTYRFSHRSFQEYFAALYITQLSDEMQKRLITSWMKETGSRYTDNILDMLDDLQHDRFERNVIYPVLKELKAFYSGNNYKGVFTEIYDCVKIEPNDINLRIKDLFYHDTMQKVLPNRLYNESRKQNAKTLNQKISKFIEKDTLFSMYSEYFLDELSDDLIEEIMDYYDFKKRFDYCMDYLNEYEKRSKSKKRKLSSILDEL